MSRENVEFVQSSYPLVNAGGFSAVAERIDPTFTMDASQGIESSQAHDKAGLRKWFEKMDEVWEELRLEPEEVIDVDDTQVIAVVRTWARGKGSGIDIDQRFIHLWTVRGGKMTGLRVFNTKQAALEAAGLSE
jgi:ketosteroid isomerase-like protein